MQLRSRTIKHVEKPTIPMEEPINTDATIFMQEVKYLISDFNGTSDVKERIYHLADLYGYLKLQLPRFKSEKSLQKLMNAIKEKTPHHFESFPFLLQNHSNDDKFTRELQRLSLCMIDVMKMLQ